MASELRQTIKDIITCELKIFRTNVSKKTNDINDYYQRICL